MSRSLDRSQVPLTDEGSGNLFLADDGTYKPINADSNIIVERHIGDGTTTTFPTSEPFFQNGILVFQNGIQLVPNVDFDSSSGTEVVFNEVPANGDEILFHLATGGSTPIATHNDLAGRDPVNTHPISSITDLETTLDNIDTNISDINNNINDINNNINDLENNKANISYTDSLISNINDLLDTKVSLVSADEQILNGLLSSVESPIEPQNLTRKDYVDEQIHKILDLLKDKNLITQEDIDEFYE